MKHLYINQSIAMYLVFFLTFFTSCRKESGCSQKGDEDVRNILSDSNIAKFPYKGFDTLVFLSDSGDTAIYVGGEVKNYFQLESTVSISGTADCSRVRRTYNQIIDIRFFNKDANNSLRFEFWPAIVLGVNYLQLTFYIGNLKYAYGDLLVLLGPASDKDSIFYQNEIIHGGYLVPEKAVLYHVNYGIIRFKDLNGLYWTLKRRS